MPVHDPKVVDAVGIDKASGEVILTITDAWPWDDRREHLALLQDKLNHYMGFIEQELLAAYPSAEGRRIRIDVIFKHPVPQEAEAFLASARGVVHRNGWSLSWREHAA